VIRNPYFLTTFEDLDPPIRLFEGIILLEASENCSENAVLAAITLLTLTH
jgi:hypothetical protein